LRYRLPSFTTTTELEDLDEALIGDLLSKLRAPLMLVRDRIIG
jgi:hypothetical protein